MKTLEYLCMLVKIRFNLTNFQTWWESSSCCPAFTINKSQIYKMSLFKPFSFDKMSRGPRKCKICFEIRINWICINTIIFTVAIQNGQIFGTPMFGTSESVFYWRMKSEPNWLQPIPSNFLGLRNLKFKTCFQFTPTPDTFQGPPHSRTPWPGLVRGSRPCPSPTSAIIVTTRARAGSPTSPWRTRWDHTNGIISW